MQTEHSKSFECQLCNIVVEPGCEDVSKCYMCKFLLNKFVIMISHKTFDMVL